MKNTTNFAKEFKLYENLFSKPARRQLKESRSVAEIQAEINRIQQEMNRLASELADARTAEKAASYGDDFPAELYIWDAYLDESEKGTFTSAELYKSEWDGTVFETKDEAFDAGYYHLQELADEDELGDEDEDGEFMPADPDDYTIDVVAIPLAEVSESALRFSDLEHLIDFKRSLSGK